MQLSDKSKNILSSIGKFAIAVGILMTGGLFIWVSTFDIPNLQSFANRQVEQSTKIYDRTGEVVLYDLNRDVRRTTVPLSEISENLQKATIAIEDSGFYEHAGIHPPAIARAIYTNIKAGGFEQGGSTITQQVVKNTLLTPEKTISRKVKEWILALRLDQEFEKDTILEIYLNEVPYGGRVYGAEEAADQYFGKSASDLTLAESAYLAALPKAPTYYSPYGNNRQALENRKNEVLREMLDNNLITQEEFDEAESEEVTFVDQDEQSLKAPHFVFHIKEQLEEEYGTTAIERRGLKVVTTLDYDLQQEAEDILSEYGSRNAQQYNANNASLVAVNPNNGQILTMVGSRDYGNDDIQGSFNAATALRQPGSAFKPFAYATALNKGYTPETTVFDLPTQFSVNCSESNFSSDGGCFSPVNYDDRFRGPITLRNALSQSVNVPSVKTFYLAGMEDSLDTAQEMGVDTLDKQPDRYGLSLVLGSGEVTLLDLTSAYGVFANDGVKNPHTGILRIEDASGQMLQEFEESSERVLPENTARQMNDILSDNQARAPSFGPNSPLHFENYSVAAKTGTTNNYLDLWTVGYSPNLSVGVWSGNNDNEPVDGEVAGFVVAPMWHAFFEQALSEIENDSFTPPTPAETEELKPILHGEWRGGYLADDIDINEDGDEPVVGGVHSILHWVDRNNPRGPVPSNPASDPQYQQWEYSVQRWVEGGGFSGIDSQINDANADIEDDEGDSEETDFDENNDPFLQVSNLKNQYRENQKIEIEAENTGSLDRIEVFVNGTSVGDDDSQPFSVSFEIEDVDDINEGGANSLTVRGYNEDGDEAVVNNNFRVMN